MEMFDNYNDAKKKYGIEVVDSLSKLGLPSQYLLSACKFVTCDGVPQKHVINLFKEWMKYVAKYNNTDVNTLSYDQFHVLIGKEKSKHCITNVIFNNEVATLGKLNNAKDVQSIPVRSKWRIKSQNWFNNYTSKGYEFFIIYLPQEPLPFTFTIAAISDGEIRYYHSDGYNRIEDNNNCEWYQSKLPQDLLAQLHSVVK